MYVFVYYFFQKKIITFLLDLIYTIDLGIPIPRFITRLHTTKEVHFAHLD